MSKPFSLYDFCGVYVTTVYAQNIRAAVKTLTSIRYGEYKFRYTNSAGKEMWKTVFLCG